MEFTEFAKLLWPIIGGGLTVGDFTYELFSKITNFSDDNKNENILEIKEIRTFKAYYLGQCSIRKIAKDIRKSMEPSLFEEYIDNFSDEARIQIYHALANYVPGMTDQNVSAKTAELFKEIIIKASTQKRNTKSLSKETVCESKESIKDENDFYLLDECKFSCPICGKNLFRYINGAIKPRFKRLYIVPLGKESFERKEFEQVTNLRIDENLHEIKNQLLVCVDCADRYENITPNDCKKLIKIKENLIKNKNIYDLINDIEIEKGLNQILLSFATLKEKPLTINKNDLVVYKVDTKIPENLFLRETITTFVLSYYRYIENLFKQYEGSNLLRFNKVKNEISQCFETLDEQDISQQEIFDIMVEWLHKQSGCKNITACQIIIAFFVQNCEVFYEIAE